MHMLYIPQIIQRFEQYLEQIKDNLSLWRRLSILDPRNIQNAVNVCEPCPCTILMFCVLQQSYEHYADILGPREPAEFEDEDVVRQFNTERNVVKLEWERYLLVCPVRCVLMLNFWVRTGPEFWCSIIEGRG